MSSGPVGTSSPGGGHVESTPETNTQPQSTCADKRGVQMVILAGFGFLFIIPGVFLTAYGKYILDEAKDDDNKEGSLAAIIIGPILIACGLLFLAFILLIFKCQPEIANKFCKYSCDRHCCKNICVGEHVEEMPIYAVDTDVIDRFAPSVFDDMYSESYAQYMERSGLPPSSGGEMYDMGPVHPEELVVSGGGSIVNGVFVEYQPRTMLSRRYSDPLMLRIGETTPGESEG